MKCESCDGKGKDDAGKTCFACDGSGEICDICGEASEEPGANVCKECANEQA